MAPIIPTDRLPQLAPFRPLMAIGDIAVVWLAGIVAAYLTVLVRPEFGADWILVNHFQVPMAMGALLTPGTMNWFGVYRSWRGQSVDSELRPVLLGIATVFMTLAFIALATKTTAQYPRVWMANWILLSVLGVFFLRVISRSILQTLHERGFDTTTVALVGGGLMAKRVAEHLRANPQIGLKAIGYFATTAEEQDAGFLPCLGSAAEVKETLEQHPVPIDQLWMVLPLSAEEAIRGILNQLRHSTVDIRMVPDMFGYHLLHYSTENLLGLPVLNLSYSPLSGPSRYTKEMLDRVLALAILAVISPLMLLIAALIKLTSPGPVIFRQTRHGWDGEPFTVYKFRTMHNHRGGDRSNTEQARRNDPRITPLGLWLRRTSLDELPQFINVLQGNMSIVGPRPHPVELNDLYCDQVERYMWRHKVKPGITGWAQVNGYRGETDTIEKMRKRIEYDLYYIDRWSLWFDVKIILLTLLHGFTGGNAY